MTPSVHGGKPLPFRGARTDASSAAVQKSVRTASAATARYATPASGTGGGADVGRTAADEEGAAVAVAAGSMVGAAVEAKDGPASLGATVGAVGVVGTAVAGWVGRRVPAPGCDEQAAASRSRRADRRTMAPPYSGCRETGERVDAAEPSQRCRGELDAREGADPDSDGVVGKFDLCPDVPEDIDGYQDQDGCPDLDNDGDGIPDINDQCQSAGSPSLSVSPAASAVTTSRS
jgi:hypothetical protein